MEIIIKNNSDSSKNVVLFGYNRNFLKQRFGNPEGIEIKIEYGNEYLELITTSAYKPFKIKSFLIETFNNGYKKKSLIVLNLYSRDANGQTCSIPIKLENRIKSDYTALVDGNVELLFEIGANSEFLLDIDVSEQKIETEKDKKLRERKRKLLLIN